MTECYVCYDPCDEPAPCLCKTMYVHPSCILIMKMYGKTECGVCKTPYPGPTVEPIPEENFMPDVIEEPLPPTPCWCILVPTFYRLGLYRVTEGDKLFDIIRYVILFMTIMIIFHFITHPNSLEIGDDWLPSFVFFTGLLCCCNILAQKLKSKQRNSRLQRRRDIVIA